MNDLVSDRLTAHLRHALGCWPPSGPLTIASSPARERPGWDGKIRPVTGVATPEGTVLSVPQQALEPLRAAAAEFGTAEFDARVAAVIGVPGRVLNATPRYRWTAEPAPFPDTGEWVEPDDSRIPAWLKPFNGGVLCAWDGTGRYGAGVGIKAHDEWAHEISVGTEPSMRGQGIARRLVATAAHRIIASAAVPLYLHAESNSASAHVAEAAGFPDRGWRVVGFIDADGDPDS